MPYFKDSENKLYWLEKNDDPVIWLPGCVVITDEEAKTLAPQTIAPTYKELRAAEYPSFADQFDILFHSGVDAWKLAIQKVKDKYPKV